MDCGAGLFVRDVVLFDGNQRFAIHNVRSGIGKRDPGDAVLAGLDQVAFIEDGMKIGVNPLHRIHFLYLNLSVEVHKLYF